MIDKIMRRLKLIFGVGNVISGNQNIITAEFSKDETIETDFAQGYGLKVYPLPQSKAVTIFNAGDRSKGITIIAHDKTHATELNPGEVMLYDDKGQFVHLKQNGIEIRTDKTLTINAKNINIRADDGDINIDGISFKNHTHLQNNGNDFGGGVDTMPPTQVL